MLGGLATEEGLLECDLRYELEFVRKRCPVESWWVVKVLRHETWCFIKL